MIVETYVRPVMRRERNTLVHWWYTPDSYDTWVPDINIDIELDDKYDPDGAWEVIYITYVYISDLAIKILLDDTSAYKSRIRLR